LDSFWTQSVEEPDSPQLRFTQQLVHPLALAFGKWQRNIARAPDAQHQPGNGGQEEHERSEPEQPGVGLNGRPVEDEVAVALVQIVLDGRVGFACEREATDLAAQILSEPGVRVRPDSRRASRRTESSRRRRAPSTVAALHRAPRASPCRRAARAATDSRASARSQRRGRR